MKELVLLSFLWISCHSLFQDLTGKQLTFLNRVGAPHVVLHSGIVKISAMTMCQRFLSDVNREQVIFSLATPADTNAILLTRRSAGAFKGHIGPYEYTFTLPQKVNEWNSICWTWNSKTGLTQLHLNGKRSAQKYITSDSLITSGAPSIILGQEQDTYGGGFDSQQAFEGHVTDVHFWDYVLRPCEIRSYISLDSVVSGNVLSWKALKYEIVGPVLVQDSDFDEELC